MLLIDQQRELIKGIRQNLSEQQIQSRAMAMQEIFTSKTELSSHSSYAVYLPVKGEASPEFITHYLWQNDKTVYLPVLEEQYLKFATYAENSTFTNNRFSIPEPVSETYQYAQALDCIVLPLTLFDNHGNRAGMGGGFYDRTLEFCTTAEEKPLLIGLAYDIQEQAQLQPQEWDVPLDYVLTESRLLGPFNNSLL